MQDFKHLQIWQRSYALAVALYQETRPFRRAGHTGLRGQLHRAADSVSANIVEGCGAATSPEFARYLDIAIKSANETEHHLLFARDLGLLSPEKWGWFAGEIVEIRKMIYAYRARVLSQGRTPRT